MTTHDEPETTAGSSVRKILVVLMCLGFLVPAIPTTAQAARLPVVEDAQAATLADVTAAAGRVLLGQIFVISGVRKIPNFTPTAARMTAYGLPMAETLLVPTIGLEIGGGLMLAANIYPDWAAGALSLFVIPTTFIFHNFWSVPTAVEAAREQIQFMKNLAILGGLLTVFSQSVGQDR